LLEAAQLQGQQPIHPVAIVVSKTSKLTFNAAAELSAMSMRRA
jgi:hypothetical protein